MISFYDAITVVQCEFLSFEPVIREVQIHRWRPGLLVLVLMPCRSRVMRDKNAIFGEAADACLLCVGGYAPGKIVDIFLKELPCVAKVFCDVELLVDLAGVILEFGAVRPSGSQSPLFLCGMILELVNSLPRIQPSDFGAAIFGHPINAVRAYL